MRKPTVGEWIALLGAGIVLLSVVFSVLRTNEAAHQARTTAVQGRQLAVEVHKALCALKVERVQSVATQEGNLKRAIEFLHTHPHGGADFSRADIETSIASQRNQLRLQKGTVRAFRYLTC